MREHVLPHIRFNINAQHMSPVGHNILQRGVQRIDGQQDDTGDKDQRPILAWQQIINKFANGQRKSKLKESGDDRARKIKNEQSLIRTIVRKKLSDQVSSHSKLYLCQGYGFE